MPEQRSRLLQNAVVAITATAALVLPAAVAATSAAAVPVAGTAAISRDGAHTPHPQIYGD